MPVARLAGRQRREDAVPAKVEGIKRTLRDGGKIEPLMVADLKNGRERFMVLDGHHRLWAAQELGLDVLPVVPSTPFLRGRKPGRAVEDGVMPAMAVSELRAARMHRLREERTRDVLRRVRD